MDSIGSIGPMTNNIIKYCSDQLKNKDTREKISKNIINPLVKEIMLKLLPFILFQLIIQIFIIVILIYKLQECN
jgi:hypothetical protein